jgi:iron-sulfur cluster assembly accessory protein
MMSVETFDVREQLVTVTPAAARHFRSSVQAAGVNGVRIDVRESGCTGFKYVLDEVAAGDHTDLALALDQGITLYISAAAMPFLRGTEIDYVREGVNYSLKFINPNVTAECGCGESFSVE